MNIRKEHLKKFVKQVVRENLSEREYKRLISEVSPPGKKSERMIHNVKESLQKSHPDWSEDKITGLAIATGWKSYNKTLNESQTEGLDQLVRLVVRKGIKDQGQAIYLVQNLFKQQHGTDADTSEIAKLVKQHMGTGNSISKPQVGKFALGALEEESYKVVAPNEVDITDEDKARTIQTDPKVTEASYKVVAPKSSTDAKEDKARRIQAEPKVNETAYKTQGPSYKTFEDSPQLPDAVNDPENA